MFALHQLREQEQVARKRRQEPGGTSAESCDAHSPLSSDSWPFTVDELDLFPALRKRNFFIVQRHAATALHYDLRLQVNNGLISWAIPFGLFGLTQDKGHLAVETTIHGLRYAVHEGADRPVKGAQRGTLLWDVGEYIIDDVRNYDSESPGVHATESDELGRHEEQQLADAMKRISDGHGHSFHIILRGGRKLTDHAYILIWPRDSPYSTKFKGDGTRVRNWLIKLPKGVKGYPWEPGGEEGTTYGRSVKTGRTLGEVCAWEP